MATASRLALNGLTFASTLTAGLSRFFSSWYRAKAGEAASENAATCKRTALRRMVGERGCYETSVGGRRFNGIRVRETEPSQRWGNGSRNARRGRRACRRARVDRIGGILGRLTQRTRVVCFHASATIGLGLGEGKDHRVERRCGACWLSVV